MAAAPATARGSRVVGHIDEIGLIVTHIDDEGYLCFAGVGGWDPQILVGQRVEVIDARRRDLPGVVGKKPIHLLKDEERKKVAEIKDLHIDIGAKDGDEARGLVRIGDVAVIAGEPVELPNDRRRLALDGQPPRRLRRAARRRGSSPRRGGAPGRRRRRSPPCRRRSPSRARARRAFALEPDVAIVVDVTHATDAPGVEIKELGKHELGSGPVIERGSTLNPAACSSCCTRPPRPRTSRSRSSAAPARTGTDADAVHLSPRRRSPPASSRSRCATCTRPVELVQLDDVRRRARA